MRRIELGRQNELLSSELEIKKQWRASMWRSGTPLAQLRGVVGPPFPIGVWVSSFAAGGTERQMVHLIRGLDPALFTVHAVCFHAAGPWLGAVSSRAASVAEFRMHRFQRPQTWRQVGSYARWCRRQGIAAVITSDFYTNVFGMAGAALAGVPVRIAGRREINTDKTAAKLLLQRLAYGLAHRVVANSQAAAARLRQEGMRSTSIRVVWNGIDLPADDPAPRSRPIRRAITVANLRAEKGHDVLIDAIASRPQLREMQFDFAGDGPCREALERRARERGVTDHVTFLGERQDIPRLLEQADLFILPSLTEALPNSVMEAMAAGLPIIASHTGGIPELLEDGVTGLLVTPGSVEDLGGAIVQMASDPRRAGSLGAAARTTVADRFSMERMVGGFTDILLAEFRDRLTPSTSRLPFRPSEQR